MHAQCLHVVSNDEDGTMIVIMVLAGEKTEVQEGDLKQHY